MNQNESDVLQIPLKMAIPVDKNGKKEVNIAMYFSYMKGFTFCQMGGCAC